MSNLSAYLMVAGAIATEVAGTLSLRASDGLTRLGPSVVVVAAYLAAFVFLAQALRSLQVGPVYAVWSGVGTVGTFIGGAALFGEEVRPATVCGAALILIGVVVVYLGGPATH